MRSGKKSSPGLLPGLVCLVAMLFAACSGSGPSGGGGAASPKAAGSKQVFVDSISVPDTWTLDPALATDVTSIRAIDLVFTGLVQLDDNLKVYGELAQSWNQSPDGLAWTFDLRHNLKFSDGTSLTSHAVAYSID